MFFFAVFVRCEELMIAVFLLYCVWTHASYNIEIVLLHWKSQASLCKKCPQASLMEKQRKIIWESKVLGFNFQLPSFILNETCGHSGHDMNRSKTPVVSNANISELSHGWFRLQFMILLMHTRSPCFCLHRCNPRIGGRSYASCKKATKRSCSTSRIYWIAFRNWFSMQVWLASWLMRNNPNKVKRKTSERYAIWCWIVGWCCFSAMMGFSSQVWISFSRTHTRTYTHKLA